MARASSHLIIRNGVYTYRRRIPSWLRDRPEFGGKPIFQKSLGVRTSAEARKRIQQLRLDDLFAPPQANDNSEKGTYLSDVLLRQIASDHYRRGVEGLRRGRNQPGEADADELAAQNIGALNDPQTAERTRDVLRASFSPALRAKAEGLAERMGVEQTASNLDILEAALFDAELEIEGVRVDLAHGRAFPSSRPGSWMIEANERLPTAPEAHWSYKRLAEAAIHQGRLDDARLERPG